MKKMLTGGQAIAQGGPEPGAQKSKRMKTRARCLKPKGKETEPKTITLGLTPLN